MPNLEFVNIEPHELALDYSLGVNPFTGSASAHIPLRTTPGRAEFGPALSLDYDSSGANSPFGVGWSLNGLLTISVNTRKRLPRYDDRDEFTFSATGDLVPALDNLGDQWQQPVYDAGAYWVRRYRSRFEHSFLRVEQWVEKSTGRIHWRTRDARNVLTIYGLRADGLSRIADPTDPKRTFLWLPEATYDPRGSAIGFEYAAEDRAQADFSQSFERSRSQATSQRYLKRVLYGNSVPLAADGAVAPENRWAFELVFDYGDHSASINPSPLPDQSWTVRPDAFSTFRPGFEVRTYRLCRRILQFHNFPVLAPNPVLTGVWSLEHDLNPAGATLRSITYTGCRTEPGGAFSVRSMPPLVMTYTAPAVATSFAPAPVQALENVPYSLAENRYRWVDLYGEGLPGLLSETSGGWFYNCNDGGGSFEPQRVVSLRPAVSLANSVLNDFDADGNTDVAVTHGRTAGYYEFNRDSGEWTGFRPFPDMPHLEAAASAQWLDMNGDGRPDLVLTGPNQVLWFPSEGKDGFGGPVEIPRPQPSAGRAPLSQDPLLDFFFADMNGDGLVDQVYVGNGRVEYWPQVGNGQFGDPILMEDSPTFAPDGEFDPTRVLLVDLDGTGGADIVYLGNGEVRYWINAEGNRLIEGGRISNLPYIDNVSPARVLDFLGDGTPCLVWSAPTASGANAIQYLPLTDGVKPRLMLSLNNSMGMSVEISYSSSAAHYLRDARTGRPWRTRLPNHLFVADRRQVSDAIGGCTTVTRYEYHDGYYDGEERSFAGFGVVDQYDADASSVGATDPSMTLTAPACLRVWFHQGHPLPAVPAGSYASDATQAVLEPLVFEEPDELDADEFCDGWRALNGMTIRQELFTAAGGRPAADPFQVTENSYRLRRLQPATARNRASFTSFQGERLTYTYEQQADDPRVTHELTLEVDDYGNPTEQCSVAYPRRSTAAAVSDAQGATLITVHKHTFLNVDQSARYELAILFEEQEFEVAGVQPPIDGTFRWSDIRKALPPLLANPLPFGQDFAVGSQARLIGWNRTFYWRTTGDGALPLGQVGAPVLLHHVETACFTPAWASQTWGARVDKNILQNDAGYKLASGYWWETAETFVWNAAAGFFQLAQLQRDDGAVTSFSYDADYLLMEQVQDPAGNLTRASMDYNVLAPSRIADANDNVSEVRYDALGIAVVSTAYGQVLDANGTVQGYGNDPLASYSLPSNPAFADVLANPASYVQNATQYTWYDLDSWTAQAIPPRTIKLIREQFVHDGTGTPPAASRIQTIVVHADGFHNLLQTKTLAEPGPALERAPDDRLVLDANGIPVEGPPGPRWLASGHTVYNRKEQPVREYEPFYSATPQYEPEDALAHFGVFTQYQYDAPGRHVREDYPNGTFSRTEYHAWETVAWDENDTVLESIYKQLRNGLPLTDPEKKALVAAEAHANTPVHIQLNPHGVETRRVNSAAPGDDRITEINLDIRGNTLSVIDPRGKTAHAYQLDMKGRALHVSSMDAGERAILLDTHDRPVHQWDALGVHERRRFDGLDRPVSISVDGGLGLNQIVQQYIYGEDATIDQARLRNLRGHTALVRDEAGTVTYQQRDMQGHPLRSVRQLRVDYKTEPDWSNPGGVALDSTSYVTAVNLDALGRIASQSPADGTMRRLEYLQGGGLGQITVSSSDGKLANFSVVAGATYNARGERTRRVLGNGVTVDRAYDSETFRVNRITATRQPTNPGATLALLQDLRYTYDPAANIVYAVDQAQMLGLSGGFLQGLNVSPETEFTYDALYQLKQATGRVHQALLENDYIPGAAGTIKGTRHLTFNNGAAVERYTRNYDYDLAGNLRSVTHRGVTRNWKTRMWISASSNRSLPALDPAGNSVTNPESRFDANGNCVYFPYLRTIAWNYRRSLARAVMIDRSAQGQPDDAEYYVYDCDGQRIRKVTETFVSGQLQVAEVVYLDGCEIRRTSVAGQPILARATSHISDGTETIALIHRWSMDTRRLETSDISRARVRFQLTNHLGSSMIELDELGAVINYEEYFPFGGTAFIAGDNEKEIVIRVYRFSGKECDDFTGLYCFGFRYYASWMGRWISPDPIGPQDDLNLYRYVKNNPVCLFDPDGLQGRRPAGFRQFVPFEDLPQSYQTEDVRQKGVAIAYTTEKDVQFKEFSNLRSFQKYVREHHGWFDVYNPSVQNFYVALRESGESKTKAMQDAQQLLELEDSIDAAKEEMNGAGDGKSSDKGGGGEGGQGTGDPGTGGDKTGDGTGTGTSDSSAQGDGAVGKDDKATGADGNGADGTGTTSSADSSATGSNDASGSSKQNTSGSDGGQGEEKGKGTGTGGTGTGAGGGGGTGKGGGTTGGTGTGAGTGAAKPGGTGHGGLADFYAQLGGKPNGVPGGLPGGAGTAADAGPPGTTLVGPPGGREGKDAPPPNGHPPRTPGQVSNGTDPNGSPTGSPSGKAPNGSGKTDGQGTGTGTGSGNHPGAPGGTSNGQPAGTGGGTGGSGGGTGGSGGGTGGKPASAWDKVLTVAGWTNLEFSEEKGGEEGGIPGGAGRFNLGLGGQIAYVIVSIVNLVLMVKAIVQSVAKGALSRMLRAIGSPRNWIRAAEEFATEGASAWRKFWSRAGGSGPGQRLLIGLKAMVWDNRAWKSITSWRNFKAFLFKPRWFGTLERVGGRSLYSWEHIIPQEVYQKYLPRMKPFINSYFNTFLRLPWETNSSLGGLTIRRLTFYIGATQAVRRSFGLGWWLGNKIIEEPTPPPAAAQPSH